VSYLTGGDWTGGGSSLRGSRAKQVSQRKRRAERDDVMAAGTIACPQCDAPVAIGADRVAVEEALRCPFCMREGPVREFLSLAPPIRATRVRVTLRMPTLG
jgi:hypothetical protein